MLPTPVLLLIDFARAVGFEQMTRESVTTRMQVICRDAKVRRVSQLRLEDVVEATVAYWFTIVDGGAASVETAVRRVLETALRESPHVRKAVNRERMLQAVNLRLEGNRLGTLARMMAIDKASARSLIRQAWLYLCRLVDVSESTPALLTPKLTAHRRLPEARSRVLAAIQSWDLAEEKKSLARQLLECLLVGNTVREASNTLGITHEAASELSRQLWKRVAVWLGCTLDDLNDRWPELRSPSRLTRPTGQDATRTKARVRLYGAKYYEANRDALIRSAVERKKQKRSADTRPEN